MCKARLTDAGAHPGEFRILGRRHERVPRRERRLRRGVHLLNDPRLDLLKARAVDPLADQVLLVEPDRVAAAPVPEELGREGPAGLGLVARASRSSWVAWPPMRNVSMTRSDGPPPERARSAARRVAA